MLLITFSYDDKTYAIDTACVQEVLPYVNLRTWTAAEDGFSGLLNYRGQVLPVMDIALLLGLPPSRSCLSTRMAVFDIEGYGLAALLMEQATETISVSDDAFQSDPVMHKSVPCLGRVFLQDQEIVQLIDTQRLFTERMKQIPLPADFSGFCESGS